jgi:hypothetical protein
MIVNQDGSLPDFSPFGSEKMRPEDLDRRLRKPKPSLAIRLSCWTVWACALTALVAGTVAFVRWAI